jgi:lauroyl/myristoyl acyltransferase
MTPTRKALLIGVQLALLPVYAPVLLLCFFLTMVPTFPTRTGLANLKDRLSARGAGAHALLACVYFNYFVYLIEVVLLWPLGLEVVEGEADLLAYMGALKLKYGLPEKRGFVVVGAHFSNIESAGAALCRTFRDARMGDHVILAKPAASAWMTRLLDSYRTRRGIHLLWTDRKDLLRVLVEHARTGDSLCFLVDQKPASGGLFVRFFGAWAAFPYAGPDVGLRFEMPVLHVTARRILPGWFRLVYAEGENSHLRVARSMPPDVERSGTRYEVNEVYREQLTAKELRMAPIMGAYAGWLEAVIRSAPTQWFWDYRKWSRKPGPSNKAADSAD